MARVVLVHGLGHQYSGESTLRRSFLPALQDGLRRVEVEIASGEVECAFYGDLFRPSERVLSGSDPLYDAMDVDAGVEQELLQEWWAEAAVVDPGVPPPEARTLARTPRSVQAALNALSGSRFFAGIAERAMIADLKQVRRYFSDLELRREIRGRVEKQVGADTAVLVAHSLGSVVAYEALCANPDWQVETFVTLGSPLGIRNLIFHRLEPAPVDDVGVWPGSVRLWTNVADSGDVVALVKDLRPRFGDRVRNVLVNNGSHAHDMTRYLTSGAVGRAVAG